MFETYWTEVFRIFIPGFEIFFRVVTELGSDYFYVITIAVGFWVVDKRASILIIFMLAISLISNYWLKIIFRIPRPPVTNWLPGVQVSNYSLPSGHAQNSVIFWGWLGIKLKTWWMNIFSIVFIVLIGLSRIFIGVHWLEDIIFGWIVGLILLIIIWKLEKKICSALSKYNLNLQYFVFVIFGLGAMILTEFLSPINIEGVNANFGPTGGLIIGLGIGLALEKKFVNFEITSKYRGKYRVAFRVIFGLMFVFSFAFGLSIIFTREIYWMYAMQYALITIIVIFVWPFIFKKLGL